MTGKKTNGTTNNHSAKINGTNGTNGTNGVEVVKEKSAAELQKEAKKKEKDDKFKEKQAKLAAAAAVASTKEPKAKVEKSTEPLSTAHYTSKTPLGEKKGNVIIYFIYLTFL